MTTSGRDSYILALTDEDRELRRLQMIEADYDFHSQARLSALGLSVGAACLEAGVGAGSIARWMAVQAGPGGNVVGVDMSDQYFDLNRESGVTLHRADIRDVDLPDGGFDFIHARCLVMHIPEKAELLARFFRWLKPGGWVVLADWDFSFPFRTSGAGGLLSRVADAAADVVASRGGDARSGAKLPYMLVDAGFTAVDGAGFFPISLPWGHQPEFLALSVQSARHLISLDLSDQDYDEYYASLPESVQTGHVLVMSWGRRPTS